VGNCSDALFISLKALGIGKGDDVITVANSFIATSEAISLTGASVKFVDCDKYTYNIDLNRIEESITDRTKAIVPVHLYGQPASMDGIREIAQKYKLFVIEDAAQAHGAEYKGQRIGTFGNVACFSFFPGKNLGAYGDAGAIVTNNDELAAKMRMFANHGRVKKYSHQFEGVNSRMDGLQAAILNVKLKYLEEWTERRRVIARAYDDALRDVVQTPTVNNDVRHVYHLYVIRVEKRDDIRAKLSEKGIATGIHYPISLPFLPAYSYLKHKPEDFPVAYAYQNQILSLPMYSDLTDKQIKTVVAELKIALLNNRRSDIDTAYLSNCPDRMRRNF
jgi:dTDP-4-amino-4,6-dideoxygalactose transaminase